MIAGRGCIALAAALLAGCAGSLPVRVDRPAERAPGPAATEAGAPGAFGDVPGRYRGRAASAEKAGDLRRALLYRKVMAGFAPEDAGAREQVERLEAAIRDQVDRHYRAGVALEERGEPAKALREFLAVLVLDPDHGRALRRVKHGGNGGADPAPRSWTVREGDTLRKIAGEVYKDPDKEFLIAYFNRLPNGAPLPTGTELLLPGIDTGPEAPTEKDAGSSRKGKGGNGVRNAVERKEGAARNHREADAHYAAGMRHFLEEDLEGAIREWEKALAIDPGHAKARRDIEKARRLKGKIETPTK